MQTFSENTQVEQPTIALFAELGWQTLNVHSETLGESGTLGRAARSEVVLPGRLRSALARLNPTLSAPALDQAVLELSRDRSTLAPVNANREIYRFLKNGLNVYFRDPDDNETIATVQLIDWENPANNDFLLTSQLTVQGEMYRRRADLVGFVNGLPLLFIELKPPTSTSRMPSTATSATTKTPSPSFSGTTPSSSFPTAPTPSSAA
jgi:type I restriction enzyme R subunit